MHILLIFSLFYFLIFAGCYILISRRRDNLSIEKNAQWIFYTFLAIGFILRVILATLIKGHTIDITNFGSWAIHVANRGLPYFYVGIPFADYPPGYIYVLYLIGLMQKLFSISRDSSLFLLMLKLPSIITDLIATNLIHSLSIKKTKRANALLLSFVFLFNPAIILNSSIWGQVDSFFTIFIILMIIYLINEKFTAASIFSFVALLVKPQALIFMPVLVFSLISTKDFRIIIKSIAYGILTFILGVLPFSIIQGAFFIFKKYFDTLSSYPYVTLNAANIYALFGKNWAIDSEKFLFIPFRIWGIISILLITIWIATLCIKNKVKENLSLIALMLVTAVFVFGIRMHERYLYPALPLSLISFIFIQDKSLFLLYGALSITHFLNTGYVFILSLKDIYYIPGCDPFFLSIALLNVFFSGWLIRMVMSNLMCSGRNASCISWRNGE